MVKPAKGAAASGTKTSPQIIKPPRKAKDHWDNKKNDDKD